MKYIIETRHSIHQAKFLNAEQVGEARERIKKGFDEGRIAGAYSKLGGGSIWIVESENNKTLYRRLRELGVDEVDVTPVVDVLDVLDAYTSYHATQAKTAATQPKTGGTKPKS